MTALELEDIYRGYIGRKRMIDTSDRDRCDHCGMPLSGGYAVVHRDGRDVRVHAYTADCLAALKARIEMLEAENGLLRAEIAAHPFITRISSASTASVAVSRPAPAVALPCRLCEEAAARVEVMMGDERVALCWSCSGCGERYWLPAGYPCIHCGEPAGVQVTAADGLTRPMCHGCAGVRETG